MFQNRIGSLAVHLMSRSMMYTILYVDVRDVRKRTNERRKLMTGLQLPWPRRTQPVN